MTDSHLYPKCLGCELGLDHTWVDEDEWPMWMSKEGRQWRIVDPGLRLMPSFKPSGLVYSKWPSEIDALHWDIFDPLLPETDPQYQGHKREHTQWLWAHPHDCDLAWPERAVRRRAEERSRRRAKSFRTTVEVGCLWAAAWGLGAFLGWLISQL